MTSIENQSIMFFVFYGYEVAYQVEVTGDENSGFHGVVNDLYNQFATVFKASGTSFDEVQSIVFPKMDAKHPSLKRMDHRPPEHQFKG